MRAEDIKDAESLQAWLESLPQETEAERETARRWAMTIAGRSAMRVLPVWWTRCLSNGPQNYSSFALSFSRLGLCSESAQVKRTMALKAASKTALADASSVFVYRIIAEQTSPTNREDATLLPIRKNEKTDSNESTINRSAQIAVRAGISLQFQFATCSEAFWVEASSDCEEFQEVGGLSSKALWDEPNELTSIWSDLSSNMLAQGEGWRFWVEWYENALYGRPQDYDLLTKIALIDSADWDKGADHVNALIQRIVAEHKLAPAPKAPPPKAVVERVKASVPVNASTLALQLHSLIETIAQEREHLRGLNAFSSDEKRGLHDALDNLESAARHLLDLLPEQTALTEQAAEDMASWAVVLKDQAQHWNLEAKKVVAGKPADDRVAFAGRLVFAAAVATPLSLMGLGSFAAVAGGAILLKDKLDVQKAKDAIRSVTSSQ